MPNLVKQRYVVSDNRQVRMINSNAKLEEIYRDMNMTREDVQSPPEFEEGLFAERVEVSDEFSGILDENPEPFLDDADVQDGEMVAEDVQQLLAQAQQQAEEILALAKQEAEELRKQAYEEGFAKGEESARNQWEEKKLELERLSCKKQEQLEEEYDKALQTMEQQIVDAFIQIIRDVLTVEIADYSGIVSELIYRTIKHLDNPKQVAIYVGEENYSTVKAGESKLQENLGNGAMLEILRDENLDDRECRIETERGIYNCGYDAQLTKLLSKMKALSIRS